MAGTPNIPDEDMAAHEAAADEVIGSILGDLDDDPAERMPGDEPVEEAEAAPEEAEDGLQAEEAGEAPEEEDLPEEVVDDENAPGYTEDEQFDAIQALRRDGLSVSAINAMDEAEMVAHGLKRHAAQAKTDEVYSERDRLLTQLGGNTPEATRDTSGAGDSASSEASDPGKTGADLTSMALPVAQKLAEMEDPDKVAPVLAEFAEKAIEAATGDIRTRLNELQGTQEQQLMRDVKAALGADFEGDFDKLQPLALQLGQAGLHDDKAGIDRAVALFRSAQLHATGGVPPKPQGKKTSTSRTRKRGAAPPIDGRTSKPRKLTANEAEDRRIAAILNGETDIEKLRAIG